MKTFLLFGYRPLSSDPVVFQSSPHRDIDNQLLIMQFTFPSKAKQVLAFQIFINIFHFSLFSFSKMFTCPTIAWGFNFRGVCVIFNFDCSLPHEVYTIYFSLRGTNHGKRNKTKQVYEAYC